MPPPLPDRQSDRQHEFINRALAPSAVGVGPACRYLYLEVAELLAEEARDKINQRRPHATTLS